MAFGHGSNSTISVDGTDVSAYTDSVSYSTAQGTAAVTAFGNDDEAFIAGLKSGTCTLSGHWDSTADGVMAGTFDGATVAVSYVPVSGVTYSGSYLIEVYDIDSPVDGKVSWRAALRRSGAETRA